MSAQAMFDALLNSVLKPDLQGRGFRAQDGIFVAQIGSNLLMIEPQKSTKSTVDRILFTFNLKVISGRLATLVDECEPVRTSCPFTHWRQRLGGLLPSPGDHWWGVSEAVPGDAAAALMGLGVPAVLSVGSDESLRDLWLTGRAPGLSELQRLIYLSTLLAIIGPVDELSDCIQRLEAVERNAPTRDRVDRHLRLLTVLRNSV
jgi:hypothetical protein